MDVGELTGGLMRPWGWCARSARKPRQYRRRDTFTVETKGLQDLVSEADLACEDEIVSTLTRMFPAKPFSARNADCKIMAAMPLGSSTPLTARQTFFAAFRCGACPSGSFSGTRRSSE